MVPHKKREHCHLVNLSKLRSSINSDYSGQDCSQPFISSLQRGNNFFWKSTHSHLFMTDEAPTDGCSMSSEEQVVVHSVWSVAITQSALLQRGWLRKSTYAWGPDLQYVARVRVSYPLSLVSFQHLTHKPFSHVSHKQRCSIYWAN